MEKETHIARKAPHSTRLPGRLLPRAFFEAPPEQVSPRLLGKLLIHKTPAGVLAGRIVEVEAYLGPHNQPPDPAAHTHRGPTPRNHVLFGPAGHAYVYVIYGRYFCMNFSCEADGLGGGILLRALEPVAGLSQMAANRGLAQWRVCPHAHLRPWPPQCQALGLTRAAHNGLDVTSPRSPLQVRDDGCTVAEILVTPRIGITHAVDRPLRFITLGNICVSGPRSLTGKRIDPE